MKATALLTAALLLISVIPAKSFGNTPITVLVANSVTNPPNQTYSTFVVFRGILLGGLTRLQASNQGFGFTYTEDPNYGPFLQSVNGLAGSAEERTYWQLLVKKPNNSIIIPDVGIGCYIPAANDQIILKYSTY
ncbi:transcobalamin-1-like [Amphiprion ocellaris]|uniref:Transcobalamin-like C-terminal domain-containing protein n=1 Tax=Amphiprion ocellaris TaxID=80972 RepID=A0A3Q1C921_AMPOC|nr:transcobalamin-1-like [Amphiprion ocellaris]